MNEILVCISGWGSYCQIFGPLFNQCPRLARHSRVELPWQNFVSITDLTQRREALLQSLRQKCSPLLTENSAEGKAWQTADLVILSWSLGSLLALELSLRLYQEPSSPVPRLLLLSPTAAMCSGPSAVPPGALKMMQRKLRQPGNSVLPDFASKLAASPELTQEYLQQANTFSIEELSAGLAYLIDCDLRPELDALPYPALLFSGQSDAIIPTQQSQALAQQLSQGQLEFVEGGHSPMLAQPQRIAQFLQAKQAL